MKPDPAAHVLLTDPQGGVLTSTLPHQCRTCPQHCKSNEVTTSCGIPGKRRRGKFHSPVGSVFICTADKDFVASSSLFRRELQIFSSTLARLAQLRSDTAKAETQKTRRLLHNLISLNGHALQEIYSVIDQEHLSRFVGFRSQKEFLENEIRHKSDDVARLILVALKNAAATKNELAVFRKLHEPSPKLKFAAHAIHRVVLNVANYFFQDLSDLQIQLQIDKTEVHIRLDYESVQVALYHILDNAVKYASPGSTIHVAFRLRPADFEMCFEMKSLFLDEADRARVQEEGISGTQATRLSKAGEGLGMALITQLLRLNMAQFVPTWGARIVESQNTKPEVYARNRFSILFPLSSIATKTKEDRPKGLQSSAAAR